MKYSISTKWAKVSRNEDGCLSMADREHIYLEVTIRNVSADKAAEIYQVYEAYFRLYEAEYISNSGCDTDLGNGNHNELFGFKRIEGWVGTTKEEVANHCREIKRIVNHYADNLAAALAALVEIGNYNSFDAYLEALAAKATQAAADEINSITGHGHIKIKAKAACYVGEKFVRAGTTYLIPVYADGTKGTPGNAYGDLYAFRTSEHAHLFDIIDRPQEDTNTNTEEENTMTNNNTITRDERREMIREMKNNRQALIDCHIDSSSARETVNALIDKLGREAARLIIAQAVIAKGDWDGRIGSRNREWAAAVTEASYEDLYALGFYYPDQIHPAHLDQIAAAMRNWQPVEIEEEPAAEEVSVDDLRDDLDTGNYGEYLNDYRDSSAYICDAIHEIADGHTSIYYSDILRFIGEHPDSLAAVIAEGLYDPSHHYDLYDHGQAAEYMTIERDVYDHLADSLYLAALDFLRYDLKRETIPDDLVGLIRDWCNDASSDDRMDQIPDQIRDYFAAEEADSE